MTANTYQYYIYKMALRFFPKWDIPISFSFHSNLIAPRNYFSECNVMLNYWTQQKKKKNTEFRKLWNTSSQFVFTLLRRKQHKIMSLFSHCYSPPNSVVSDSYRNRRGVCVCGRVMADRRQTLGAIACVCACLLHVWTWAENKQEKKAQDKFRCYLVNHVIKISNTDSHILWRALYSTAVTDVCNSISCNKSALHPL